MNEPDSFELPFEIDDVRIKLFIASLNSENLKLQKDLAKLQVKYFSAQNKIKALQHEIKEFKDESLDFKTEQELKEIEADFDRKIKEMGYIKKPDI